MLAMDLLIPEQWPQITSEPFWVTFFIPIRFILRSVTFQALSMRLSAFDPYLQSRFCGSCGYNALPWFLPFLRTPPDRGSSFGAVGQEAGCDDAVQLGNECGPCRDPCSGSLSVWHSTSSSVATPALARTPRSVSLPHKLTYLSQLTGTHLSCGQRARHTFVAHCIEVCWRKGHWVICTLVPPAMALDPFSHDFPASEKPLHSSLIVSTPRCPASLLDTSSSCAKLTAVSFLFSICSQGERGRMAPIICIPFIFWFVFHVESLITSGKSSEHRRVGSAFH